MHFELEIHAHEPLAGALSGPDGASVSFSGRLGLLSALDRMTADPDRHRERQDMEVIRRDPQADTTDGNGESSELWLGVERAAAEGER